MALRACQELAARAREALEGHDREVDAGDGCTLCAFLADARGADYLLRQLAAHVEGNLQGATHLDGDVARVLALLGGVRPRVVCR